MKIWFDILTPKQLLFSKLFVKYLKKQGVDCIMTSRAYSEVTTLADIHGVDLLYCGEHGKTTSQKLKNSIKRMDKLYDIIYNEEPDVAINYCSPDACRIAYGLNIPLFLLNDTPHAEITNRLTIPLAKRVWSPMIFKKHLFTKYGVTDSTIKHYNCIDAYITSNHKSLGTPPVKEKYVLVRTPESFATYYNNNFDILSILRTIQSQVDYKILILCRYKEQYDFIKSLDESQFIPTMMKYDGKMLYENAEFLIGGGGMSAEAALHGTPTIVYDIIEKNYVSDYLERKNILLRVKNLQQLKSKIKYAIQHKNVFKLRAKDINTEMSEPFTFFYDDIRQVLALE
jgi:hypothetical protein